MVDNLTKAQRSYCMSRIKSMGTKPELNHKGKAFSFLYQSKTFGSPDFINYKTKVAVFIDGCFWHKCPKHYVEPKSNKKYWLPKLERNATRAKEVNIAYKSAGWKVVRIWEHELK
ncbi:MAG: very short patch repair endonuclease [Candidatus Pacearchaeota archaeon]|nr:very short patch repair endonuclease [Candidatus Pacearchaeota archaeon]